MKTDIFYCGDCIEVMQKLPDEKIDLVVTSPPYDDLRDYEYFKFDFENTAKQLYRIVKKGGVVVWVVGDQTIGGSESGKSFKQALFFKEIGFNLHDTMIYEKDSSPYPASKNSLRYTNVFEYMFVVSKGQPATVNLIKDRKNKFAGVKTSKSRTERQKDGSLKRKEGFVLGDYSYRENIWRILSGRGKSSTDKLAFQHPAIFPEALARDHILTWSKEGDVVLDCFGGSGTTAIMSKKTKRKYIYIDCSKKYCELAKTRMNKESEFLF